MMKRLAESPLVILLPLLLQVAYYLYLHPFTLSSDDLMYSLIAANWFKDASEPFMLFDNYYGMEDVIHPPHFFYRMFVTLPIVLSFKVFGISIYTATLWPIVSSLGITLMLFLFTRHYYGQRAAIFAAFLMVINPQQIYFSLVVMADTLVSGVMMAVMMATYVGRRDLNDISRQKRWGVMVALLLCLGIFTKLLIVWVVPVLGLIFLKDMKARQMIPFWKSAIIASTLMVVAVGLFYLLYMGEVAVRFQHAYSIVNGITNYHDLIYRLTIGPIKHLAAEPAYSFPLVLAIPGLLSLFYRSAISNDVRFWAFYILLLLLQVWFGSTSFHRYHPPLLESRFFAPLIPPLSLLGGVVIAEMLEGVQRRALMKMFLLSPLVIALLWFWPFEAMFTHNKIALLFALLISVTLLMRSGGYLLDGKKLSQGVWRLYAPLVVAMLMVTGFFIPIYHYIHGYLGVTGLREEQRLFESHLSANGLRRVIIADQLVQSDFFYHNGFKIHKDREFVILKDSPGHIDENGVKISLIQWLDPKAKPIPKERWERCQIEVGDRAGREVWLLIHKGLFSLRITRGGRKVPPYFINPPPHWKPLYRGEWLDLYKLPAVQTCIKPMRFAWQ
ncbi:MAG: glycosyltransferase family 39 protein [Magnetococcales bacterium]|nr:glycosyltransferase family 39 protein [Magnetococcales bacterium]